MKLSDEQIENAKKKLDQFSMLTCPLCGQQQLELEPKLYELKEPDEGKSEMEATYYYPMFPMLCDKCGYTAFVNALILGVVD